MLEASAIAKGFSKDLDSTDGRMGNLVQTSLALGPALVPISAAAIPAMVGLSNQLGIGAAGAGVAVLAFKGLGKALDAVNKYSIDPTATNLANMSSEMSQLGPAGQDFVQFLQGARGKMQDLQELARAGLFPGLEKGIHSLSGLLPDVENIITTISTTLGELGSEAGANLNSPKWHEFIAFLDSEARPTLLAMGRTAGNFAEGLANLWMAFAPMENNFSQGFLGLSRDFAKWTDGLDKTQGFQEFLAYVDRVGPKAFDTLGSLAGAILQIVEAAAPVGEATLPVIKALADAIGTVADSDLGPVIVGVVALTSALSRLKAVGIAANSSAIGGLFGKTAYGGALAAARDLPAATRAFGDYNTAAGRAGTSVAGAAKATERLGSSVRGTAKLVGGAAGLAFVMSDLDSKMGLNNTAMLGLAGSLAGPWGAAVGAGIGLALDFASANNDIGHAVDRANKAARDSSQSIRDRIALVQAEIDAIKRRKAEAQGTKDKMQGVPGFSTTDTDQEVAKSDEALKKLGVTKHQLVQADQEQAFAEAGLSGQMAGASKAVRDETYALLLNIAKKNQAADATENAFSAETNYRKALKDADKQARTNNAGINGSSDAALANRDSLDQLATAWNRVADSGTATKKQALNARADFIKLAEGMGVADDAAIALADSILHQPDGKSAVDVDDKATPKVSALQARINRLHGKTVTINTRYTYTDAGNAARDAASVKTRRGNADGGEILGEGGPRDDLIPIWASNKEIMVNARDAQEHRDLILDINAGRFRGMRPQLFASGGEVGHVQRFASSGATQPTTTADTPSLVAALDERSMTRAVERAFDGRTFELSRDGRSLKFKVRGG